MAELSLADLAQYLGAQPQPQGLAGLAQAYNGEGGGVRGPNDPLNQPGTNPLFNLIGTPGAAAKPNPYPQGSEEAAWYDQNRQDTMNQWAPQMALSMLGAGAPAAEAGALGAGGGRLRNQWTGAFRKEGETPLPGNPYRSVNTQAKPVAANSEYVTSRTQAPTPADPALVEQNLARMDNPMVQQTAPPPAANPADVAQWRQVLINSFGMR